MKLLFLKENTNLQGRLNKQMLLLFLIENTNRQDRQDIGIKAWLQWYPDMFLQDRGYKMPQCFDPIKGHTCQGHSLGILL